MTHDAVLLTGALGMGHEMMARGCAGLLERSGWHTRGLDSMALLGRARANMGQQVFNRLLAVPGIYDGLHFAHLRTGSRLAERMGSAATARLVPALRAELRRRPADLVLSVFATGARAAAEVRADVPGLRAVVLCTDVSVHRIWVAEGTDLFLVTSAAAAESVRRYLPRAQVAVVPPPVRAEFFAAPPKERARVALGVPLEDLCALLIDSGWGFGPLVESAAALAGRGVHVLAVAGRQRAIHRRLRELAASEPLVRPFGFTDRVPELMAAADVVVTLPGATTCSEARVVGREMVLLDVMPGHGRDNLLHELELGGAHTCVSTPDGVAASVLAVCDRASRSPTPQRRVPRWEPAYLAALRGIGLDLPAPGALPDEVTPARVLVGGGPEPLSELPGRID